MLTIFFSFYFYFHTSYIFAKNSDFIETDFLKNFSDGGIMKYMESIIGPDTTDLVIHNIYPNGKKYHFMCRHIYENLGKPICPFCNADTHEIDWEFNNELHRQWIADGKHLDMQCPQGGTIRGWWDI